MNPPYRGRVLPLVLLIVLLGFQLLFYFFTALTTTSIEPAGSAFIRFAERNLRAYWAADKEPGWLQVAVLWGSSQSLIEDVEAAYQTEQQAIANHGVESGTLEVLTAYLITMQSVGRDQAALAAVREAPLVWASRAEAALDYLEGGSSPQGEAAIEALRHESPFLAEIGLRRGTPPSDWKAEADPVWHWTFWLGMAIVVQWFLGLWALVSFREAPTHVDFARYSLWAFSGWALLSAFLLYDGLFTWLGFGLSALVQDQQLSAPGWMALNSLAALSGTGVALWWLIPRWSLVKKQFGLGWQVWRKRSTWFWLGAAFILSPLLHFGVLFWSRASGELVLTDFLFMDELQVGVPGLLLLLTGYCIAAPVGEEIIFRGIVYGGFRSRMPLPWALLVSSLLFSALHFYSFQGFVEVAIAGIFYGWLYEKTRSLLPGIVLHAYDNLWFSLWVWGVYGDQAAI